MFLEDIDDLANDSGGWHHTQRGPQSQWQWLWGEFSTRATWVQWRRCIDKYLNAELIFNLGMYDKQCGQVMKRARGPKGEPIGCTNNKPLLKIANMMLSIPIICMSDTKQMWLLRICMHRLKTRDDSTRFWIKLLITSESTKLWEGGHKKYWKNLIQHCDYENS
jgi:hypothetical protein